MTKLHYSLLAMFMATPAIAGVASIAPGNLKAYCRGEAAGQWQTNPRYVSVGVVKREKDKSYSVDGTVDLGKQGKKPFRCRYTAKRQFIAVDSMTDEGAL